MDTTKLFEEHMEFAQNKASIYADRFGIEEDDAKQEALLLLHTCSKTYDPEKGEFRHYFSRALRFLFWRLRGTNGLVSYPDYQKVPMHKAFKRFDMGETIEDIAGRLSSMFNMSDEAAEATANGAFQVYSWSEFSDDFDIVETNANPAIRYIANERLTDLIKTIYWYCNERESDIVIRHLGFIDEEIVSMDTIAEEYGVSKQRIWQLYKRAIEKLQSPVAKRRFERIITN